MGWGSRGSDYPFSFQGGVVPPARDRVATSSDSSRTVTQQWLNRAGRILQFAAYTIAAGCRRCVSLTFVFGPTSHNGSPRQQRKWTAEVTTVRRALLLDTQAHLYRR